MSNEGASPELRLSPGAKLKKLRLSLGLTQAQMAEKLGISRSAVNAYEHRPNASPAHYSILTAADEFKIESSWFYDGRDNDPVDPGQNARIVVAPHLFPFDGPRVLARPLIPFKVKKGEETLYKLAEHDEVRPPFIGDGELQRSILLRVGGDAFESRAPQGSTIVFLRDSFPPHRAIALFRNEQDDVYCVKTYFADIDTGHMLLSFVSGVPIETLGSFVENWLMLGIARYIIHPYFEGTPNVEVSAYAQYLSVDYPACRRMMGESSA